MVNPRADPPIIKMMMSERTPPASSVLPLVAAVEPAYESMCCKEVAALRHVNTLLYTLAPTLLF